jgi:hypothetical protein
VVRPVRKAAFFSRHGSMSSGSSTELEAVTQII